MATTVYTNALSVGTAVVRSYRQVIPNADISDPGFVPDQIRVRFEAPAGGDCIITNASIGERSGSSEDYATGEYVRLTFDSGNNGKTITAGTSAWSDWVSYSVFDDTTDMLVHFDENTGAETKYASGGNSYIKSGVNADAMVEAPSGYSPASFEWGIVEIQVQISAVEIPIGNATLQLVGQSVSVLVDIYIPIGNATLQLVGQAPNPVVGQVVSIGTGTLSLIGQGFTVLQYPVERRFEPGTLVQPTHKDNSHAPCGHWHAGQTDNPVWTFNPQDDLPYPYHEDETKPEICGHWHKHGGAELLPCIEYVAETSWTGTNNFFRNQAPGEMLVYEVGYLYGCYDTAGTVFRFDVTTMTIERTTTFADADVDAIYQIIVDGSTIYALITRDGYEGKWIQKITIPALGTADPFTLDGDPLYCGSVTTGTDSKIYGCLKNLNQSGSYAADYKPITGGDWADYWEELPGTYSYTIDVYSDYAARSPQVTIGSNIVSFHQHTHESLGANYVMFSGPESVWLAYVAVAHQIEPDGTYYRTFNMGLDIGPWQGMIEPSGNRGACLSHETVFTQLTLYVFDLGNGDVSRTIVTGLLGEEREPRDNTIHHAQSVWAHNGLIYHLHGLWDDVVPARIVAINPDSAVAVHQYWLGGEWDETKNGFTIMGDYVYVWTNTAATEGYSAAIVKLTLTLEYVCTYQCPGLGSAEIPGSIANDGSGEIYDFGVQSPGTKLGIIHYTIPSDPPVVPEPHSPVWDFNKQQDKW